MTACGVELKASGKQTKRPRSSSLTTVHHGMSNGAPRTFSFYEVLGIECTADADVVRRAYYRHARECHPDKNSSSDATEEFRRLDQAYRVLSNPKLKRLYDTYGDESLRGTSGTLTEDSITVATQLQTSTMQTESAKGPTLHQEVDSFIGVIKARRPASASLSVLEAPVLPVLAATLPEAAAAATESATRFHTRVAKATQLPPQSYDDYSHPRKRQNRGPDSARRGSWKYSKQQQRQQKQEQPQAGASSQDEGADAMDCSTPSASCDSLMTDQNEQQQHQEQQRQQQKQSELPSSGPIKLQLYVTLEDFYKGCTKHVPFTRFVCCKACCGTGSSRSVCCIYCHGTGTVLGNNREFPDDCDEAAEAVSTAGYTQCPLCHGRGMLPIPRDECPRCHGTRVEPEKCDLSVVVPRGAHAGYTLLYHNAGHQNMEQIGVPGSAPSFSDITVLLLDAPVSPVAGTCHCSSIQRDGDDLRLTWKLSLREALCGYVIHIHHLDGKDLVLRSPPGKVTRPGDVLVVTGKGMPIFQDDSDTMSTDDPATKQDHYNRSTLRFGRFLVTMDVEFPPDNSFSEQDTAILRRIIPAPGVNNK